MRRTILLAGLALAGCEVYSVPGPVACPGTKVGGLLLGLSYSDAGSTCPPSIPVNSDFLVAATLSFQGDGGAAICLDRSHAIPFLGTHVGDHVVVGNVDPDAPVSGCTCLVTVAREISGDIVRDADGGFAGFTARWRDSLGVPGDAGAQDGGACGCGLPCQVLYTPDGGP